MVEIEFAKSFTRAYKKLVQKNPGLEERISERIDLFQQDPFHNSLHSHKLEGTLRGAFSFSAKQDLRIVYYWRGNVAVLVDIGKHDEIYRV